MIKNKAQNIEIADVTFTINCPSSITFQDLDPTYQSFATRVDNGHNCLNVEILLEFDNMPSTKALAKIFESDHSWSMFQHSDSYCLTLNPPAFEQPFWLARTNRDFTVVTLYLSEKLTKKRNGGAVIENPVHYPLDQILLMHVLAERQGAVLHSAGIEINGKGYLFPGKSGAGKSTITRQFAGRRGIGLLSDDRIVVRKIDGAFRAYGTPWPGEEGVAENVNVPLSGIFFINHGSENRIKEITPQEALERLLPVASIPWYDKELVPKMLDFCGDLVSHVPIYALHFKPSVEVVDVLEGFVANQN